MTQHDNSTPAGPSEQRSDGSPEPVIRDKRRLDPETGEVRPPQDALTGLNGRYLEGIAVLNDRIVLVLDLAAVIDVAEPLVGGAKETV